MERGCVFTCDGDPLVGVVSAVEGAPAVGVLIIVGGPQCRSGSHRHFRLLASRLSADGVPVMRFDHRGIGDSCGTAQGFESIEPDIGAAIGEFLSQCPTVRKVVLWGLCDGASAALLYCQSIRDERVAGLVLLNPWVRSEQSLAKTHMRHYYGQRIGERAFWKKLLSGDVAVRKSIRHFVADALRAASMRSAAPNRLPFENRMAEGLRGFGGPVLLILSGRDLTAKEFDDYCANTAPWSELINSGKISRFLVRDADHTFSSAAWRKNVEDLTLVWLKRCFEAPQVLTSAD